MIRRFALAGAAWLFALAGTACHKLGVENPDGAGPEATRVVGDCLVLSADSARLAGFGVGIAVAAQSQTARLNGRLVWNEDVTVRVFSPFVGRVVRVVTDAGRIVRAGDTLALIASPDFGQAEADARRAATDLELAERTLGRTRDLFAHGVAAQKDVFAAEADAARARAEADRAQARVAPYGGGVTSVNQVFALRAPLGGRVVQRNITPGEEVRPDQMLASTPELVAPLFAVTDPSRLWVQLDVPERDLAFVREGAPIAVRVQAWPDETFLGTITLVGSAVDPGTRTIKVRGTVDNPERRLKAEMLVTVDVTGPPQTGVAVPAPAVLLVGGAHVVFVREVPGRYRRTPVTVGAAAADRVTLTGGIRPGDVVVTEGSLLLEQLFQTHAGFLTRRPRT